MEEEVRGRTGEKQNSYGKVHPTSNENKPRTATTRNPTRPKQLPPTRDPVQNPSRQIPSAFIKTVKALEPGRRHRSFEEGTQIHEKAL